MTKETFTIGRRIWSSLAAITVEIECDPLLPPRLKLGLALKVACEQKENLTGAVLTDADLTGAVLRGADLTGADLTGAVLTDADLTGAVLRGAVLTDADLTGVPKIENIHQTVFAAASQPGALNMADWHTCETTHCRAGWVTTLAGGPGKALEEKIGPAGAATLIYLASDPQLGKVPNFYCGNAAAMDDMRARAEEEAARVPK